MELEELKAVEMIKEEAPGWAESRRSEAKAERPNLGMAREDVNRTREHPEEAKDELLEQGTALEDVSRDPQSSTKEKPGRTSRPPSSSRSSRRSCH